MFTNQNSLKQSPTCQDFSLWLGVYSENFMTACNESGY